MSWCVTAGDQERSAKECCGQAIVGVSTARLGLKVSPKCSPLMYIRCALVWMSVVVHTSECNNTLSC